MDSHHRVVECFQNASEKRGISTVIKKESEVQAADVEGKDMVFAVGMRIGSSDLM